MLKDKVALVKNHVQNHDAEYAVALTILGCTAAAILNAKILKKFVNEQS